MWERLVKRLRNASIYTRKKGVRALYFEARCSRGYRKNRRLFCGYSSRRFSGVSSRLLQDLKSPYDFLNFNGDFTTIETARKRSVKRLSNAQARCQLWNLRWSTTIVSFVAGACGAKEHGQYVWIYACAGCPPTPAPTHTKLGLESFTPRKTYT